HASPWGVLALCLVFLWLKRKELWKGMSYERSLALIPIGLGLVVAAVLMPSSQDYLVFHVLLASLGVFVIIFGKGAKIPSIVLAIYGFAISFPLLVERFAQDAYSRTAIAPLMGLMTILGYPIQNQGQWIHFTSTCNESILVTITAACAGPSTMGVFIALFTLMSLDMPLPPRKAIWLFTFGVVGTWFQSYIRLIVLILVGYYLGEHALWTAHFWTIYILFPPWYLLFVYIYFRQVGRPPEVREKQEVKNILVAET
ncbi:MAG: exosortase/archaeosortase family protein, partial [Dehalococcoidia bacterium]|nr:exosortase/archaeosortase family protein [Dehalococcoidia bacterium]